MKEWLYIGIVMVSGTVLGLVLHQAYALVDFIRKVEDDTNCEACEQKTICLAQKPIGRSNWVTEFMYITYLKVGRKCLPNNQQRIGYWLIPALINGSMDILLYLQYGWSADFVLCALCTAVLLYLSIVDWKTQYIPLECNLFIFILGLIRLILQPGHWLGQVIGLCSVSVVLLLVDWIGSKLLNRDHVVGDGDIKLMAAAGLFLGWKLNIVAFMMGCIGGSIIHLIIMKIGKGERQLAFGPYLAMGIYIAMICGEQLMSWYLGIMGL